MDTEPIDVEPKSKKPRPPRTAAQQETFRKAVATLKAKREAERAEKVRVKAEETLKRVEARADELRTKATTNKPTIAPVLEPIANSKPETSSAAAVPLELISHFEKLLDAKLAQLKPAVVEPVIVKAVKPKKPKKTYIVEESSSSEDDAPPPVPARRAAYTRLAPPQNAWYDSLFPPRR